MIKAIISILALVFLLVIPGKAQAEYRLSVFIIGDNICAISTNAEEMDVAPFLENGRAYIPIRFVGHALGISDDNISWNEESQEIKLILNDITVKLKIGSNILYRNGFTSQMDVVPIIRNGRTCLPARYVVEAFGSTIEWDQINKRYLLNLD